MDKLDRLLKKARPRGRFSALAEDRQYLGRSFSELLEMMEPGGGAPEAGTRQNAKFQYAVMAACVADPAAAWIHTEPDHLERQPSAEEIRAAEDAAAARAAADLAEKQRQAAMSAFDKLYGGS